MIIHLYSILGIMLPLAGSHRRALDEFSIEDGLPQVFLATSNIGSPSHDPSYHRAAVPADVGDRRFAPGERWGVVGANQRDVVWYADAPL